MSIKIDLKIFLFATIFAITKQIKMYAILMIFAIIHEIGHLISGIILKFKPRAISLTPFGLQIEFEVKCEEYNKKIFKGNSLCVKRALISMAGPFTNALIALIISIFPNKNNLLKETIIYSNILICIFNLIPIYPLDGGRIIKEILHIFYGLDKAYEYSNTVTNISIVILSLTSSVLILYLKNIAILIINVYLWILVISENRKFKIMKRVRNMINKDKIYY